jgi:signal transduction histidine kinase
MRRHLPTLLIALLFVVSATTLVASAVAALDLPGQEWQARDQAARAATALAQAAEPILTQLPRWPEVERPLAEATHRELSRATDSLLRSYPGSEGGFYLDGKADQWAGFAHPGGPAPGRRRDPPPQETRFIRAQAQAALTAAGALVEVHEIGPGRVVVGVAAVGAERPARATSWVMTRLTGPEAQKAATDRYRRGAIIGTAGILLALGLSFGLVWQLGRARRRQEQLQAELRRTEHLASLGRMLAGVAHEVRNPLAAIRSTVQLWDRLPEQARTPESLAAVVTAVDRIEQLVGRLLLFARAGHEERVPIDLNAIVGETLELLRARAAEQGVVQVAHLAEDLPTILGAASALRQVVLNLTTNALQAMPAGGTLTCRTERRGTTVALIVSDSGPGVPAAEVPRLFEPFHTTRPEGAGLGLALCREIVDQHGGRIDYVPPTEGGAAFVVLLPVPESLP